MNEITGGGEAARYIDPQTGQGSATGANVTTYTQEHRDRARAAAAPHAEVVAVPPGDKAVAVPVEATAVTATVWQPWVISIARGLAEAFVYAGYIVFAMLAAAPDADARAIVITAGGAFFLRMAAAFGIGLVDQSTAQKD